MAGLCQHADLRFELGSQTRHIGPAGQRAEAARIELVQHDPVRARQFLEEHRAGRGGKAQISAGKGADRRWRTVRKNAQTFHGREHVEAEIQQAGAAAGAVSVSEYRVSCW